VIRVAHLMNDLRPSGAERMLASSGDQWKELGVEAIIIGAGRQHPFATELRAAGYQVETLPPSRSPGGIVAIARLLRRLKPDVLHLHAEQMFVPLTAVGRATPSVRLVVRSIHSSFGTERDTRYIRIRRRRMSWALRLGMQPYACGEDVADHELLHFGRRPEVIENWVDTKTLSRLDEVARQRVRQELDIPASAFAIALIGDCAPVKNHELVLDSTTAMSNSAVVLHVGDESGMSTNERLSLESNEHAHNVRHLGRRSDVADVMCAADVIVVPSRREGFSLVAAEALCSGRPLIASATAGLDWLSSFPSARLLPLGVRDWTTALDALVVGGGPAAEALARDRQVALERFSPSRGAKNWVDEYCAGLQGAADGHNRAHP